MNKLIPLFALALTAACGKGAVDDGEPTVQLAQGTATLSIDVGTMKSSMGEVHCGLFNGPDHFPGKSPIIGGEQAFAANSGTVTARWTALPAGQYAVTCIHDENGNGKLDTNIVGAPVEGYGVTNNVFHATGPATWDEARVDVGDGATVNEQLTLKY